MQKVHSSRERRPFLRANLKSRNKTGRKAGPFEPETIYMTLSTADERWNSGSTSNPPKEGMLEGASKHSPLLAAPPHDLSPPTQTKTLP